MKYLTQKNRYSCGPIALVNFFRKKHVKNYGRKEISQIYKKIKTIDAEEGTEDKYMIKFLRKKGFVAFCIDEIKYTSLRYLLNKGYEVIATIETPNMCHYSNILEFNNRGMYFSNTFSTRNLFNENLNIKDLKEKVFYSNDTIKKLCNQKDHSLSVICVRSRV